MQMVPLTCASKLSNNRNFLRNRSNYNIRSHQLQLAARHYIVTGHHSNTFEVETADTKTKLLNIFE